MDKETLRQYVEDAFKEQTQRAFDMGWNAAILATSTSIENMKVFGDTAASFAIYIKEFQRDES